MRFHVLTLFVEAFQGPFQHSMLQQACRKGLISIQLTNIRDYAHDAHGTADDYQFGGGPGMVLKPEPVFEAAEDVLKSYTPEERASIPVVLFTPQGQVFNQKIAEELSRSPALVLTSRSPPPGCIPETHRSPQCTPCAVPDRPVPSRTCRYERTRSSDLCSSTPIPRHIHSVPLITYI